jgi:putative aminopeptidase FrvX
MVNNSYRKKQTGMNFSFSLIWSELFACDGKGPSFAAGIFIQNMEEFELLRQLCAIAGTSGDELRIRDFILDYIALNQGKWNHQPELFFGDGFQDNLILVFGKPKTALYAHMDTVGYTVRYDNYLVPIGGPEGKAGDKLVFEEKGLVHNTTLIESPGDHLQLIDFPRPLEPGTTLSYQPDFETDESFIHSPYLDNRLGIWALLQLAPEAENVAFVFSTWEEHGGGAVGYLARFLYEKYGISKALIADVTWSTEGVFPGKGPVVSLRDSRIPRRSYTAQIRNILTEKNLPFQLEVESHGGSDGTELQQTALPIDWCFIGPPSENPHSSRESVHKADARLFVQILAVLAREV